MQWLVRQRATGRDLSVLYAGDTRKRLLELGGEIPDKEVRGLQALIIKAASVRAQ
jgi:hypothetical protein